MAENIDEIIPDYDSMSIPEVEAALDEYQPEPAEVDILIEHEKENKDRKGAKKVLRQGVQYDDWGETYDNDHTKGRFRKDEIKSLLQKAIRRSDEELAAFAAWELVRSGYARTFWDRMEITSVEDLAAGEQFHLLLYRHRMMSLHDFNDSGWGAKLCAIQAAIGACRARASREATFANEYFDKVMKERVAAEREDREPAYKAPVTDEEIHGYGKFDVCIDRHTMWGRRMQRHTERGWHHFKTHGARVGPEGERPLSVKWRKRNLEMESLGHRDLEIDFSDEEIAHAIQPTGEDGGWDEDKLDRDDGVTKFRDDE